LRQLRRRALLAGVADRSRPSALRARARLRAATVAPEQMLADVLQEACLHSPHYRGLAASRGGDSIRLTDLPPMTKEVLSERFSDLIVRDPSGLVPRRAGLQIVETSGSTGARAARLIDFERTTADARLMRRLLREYAADRPGDLLDVGLHPPGRPLIERQALPRWRIAWNLRVADFHSVLARQQIEAVIAVSRPAVVWGLPSRLLPLAEMWSAHAGGRSVGVVLSSYEALTDEARSRIATAFASDVVSVYGLAELGLCGWECRVGRPPGGAGAVYPEVLDDRGRPAPAGASGRLLLTSLIPSVMPLIRYETGDIAALGRGSCGCGRESPWLAAFEGRSASRLVDELGQRHTPFGVLAMASETLGAAELQIRQSRPGHLQVILPVGAEPSESRRRLFEALMPEVCGGRFSIEILATGEFEVAPSGKRNPVVVRLSGPDGS
jgi:phenylacetate-CoA ligase